MKKCTMCGNDFDMWDEQESFCFDHIVGYGSAHDGEKIHINLCCDCFDKILDNIIPKCKINPIIDSI